MASRVKINWDGAKVTGGTLSVPVVGKPFPGFPAQLKDQVIRRNAEARGEPWGSIEYTGGTITVSKVPAGSEDELQQVLDQLLELAAAAAEREMRESEAQAKRAEKAAAEERQTDEEMTRRFRGQ
jgi:hypothetical protein